MPPKPGEGAPEAKKETQTIIPQNLEDYRDEKMGYLEELGKQYQDQQAAFDEIQKTADRVNLCDSQAEIENYLSALEAFLAGTGRVEKVEKKHAREAPQKRAPKNPENLLAGLNIVGSKFDALEELANLFIDEPGIIHVGEPQWSAAVQNLQKELNRIIRKKNTGVTKPLAEDGVFGEKTYKALAAAKDYFDEGKKALIEKILIPSEISQPTIELVDIPVLDLSLNKAEPVLAKSRQEADERMFLFLQNHHFSPESVPDWENRVAMATLKSDVPLTFYGPYTGITKPYPDGIKKNETVAIVGRRNENEIQVIAMDGRKGFINEDALDEKSLVASADVDKFASYKDALKAKKEKLKAMADTVVIDSDPKSRKLPGSKWQKGYKENHDSSSPI